MKCKPGIVQKDNLRSPQKMNKETSQEGNESFVEISIWTSRVGDKDRTFGDHG